jgi:hypothetical protein
MKQFSPEYLRVRKEIARIIADNQVTFFTDCQNLADSILEIKGIAIVADDQSLPEIDCFKGQVKRILTQAGFKRTME